MSQQLSDWIEWDGNAASIPTGMGWVQFSHETREQAMQRELSEVDYWPWYGEDEKPCVLAFRIPGDAK